MKLFLASSFNDVASLLPALEKELKGKTVTFIPTASKVEKVVFYVTASKKALRNLGMQIDELDISTASQEEIEEKLAGNDCIYVTGGNTFYLLQELKRTGADKIIEQQVQAGKLYIGESAGAIIAAPTIEYVREMDNEALAYDLNSYNALALVDFYTVPHYGNPPFKKAAQMIVDQAPPQQQRIPISNQQAIIVRDDEISIVSSL